MERVVDPLSTFSSSEYASLSEDLEVVTDRRLADSQGLLEVTYAHFVSGGEEIQ